MTTRRAVRLLPPRALLLAALLGTPLTACEEDDDALRGTFVGAATSRDVLTGELQPGVPRVPHLLAEYREDSVAVWEGMRLYNWYNCNGCHLNGGGGIGPPLADRSWIYGQEPLQIFASIIEGRPDGMPAYGGRISQGEALRIVAYVRSLAGFVPRREEMWPVLGTHMRGPLVHVPGTEHVEEMPQARPR